MKKDFFNGNIKNQFVSYVWTTIIIVAVIFFGCGGLFLYLSFSGNSDRATSILFLVLGVVSFLFGIWYSFGTIFVIRKYPKYKKITRWFFNSDYYFVDCDPKEYRGHWRGKPAFSAVTSIADQNEAFIDIRYPKKYYGYVWATVIGIVLMFVNLIVSCWVLSNIEELPLYLQSEEIVFSFFILLEVVLITLSFVFAFRVKKIREVTRKEYLEKQMAGSDE